ncbi:helix-turn-helix domain-containing protein [Nonomuraea sp. NPDC005501]|uniref:TetR/AcrR family transcriptional regulator n=1 Tax=Nonomuraea sp. NPDC005501 TaxID=3156884 RepID=UPI0033B5616C
MSTRTALIEATSELLWERGYAATSPTMIQRRAHAGQGSMYHHFSGKAGLAVAAMGYSAEKLRETAEAVLSGSGSAVERVCAYLDLERDPLAGCRLGGLVQDYDVATDDSLRAPVAELFSWLVGRITQVLEEDREDFRPDADILATASMVVAAVQGGYVLARATQDPQAFRRVTQAAKQAVRDLVRGR